MFIRHKGTTDRMKDGSKGEEEASGGSHPSSDGEDIEMQQKGNVSPICVTPVSIHKDTSFITYSYSLHTTFIHLHNTLHT